MRTAIALLSIVLLITPVMAIDYNASIDLAGHLSVDGVVNYGTVETFTDTDATPDVSTGSYWNTFTNTLTITDFIGSPADSDWLVVYSKAAITFDCTGAGFDCGTTDGVTASGDNTIWHYTGTNWQLWSFFDASTNVWTGGGADGVGVDEIMEEGSGITKRAILNFIGASVTCVDNASRSECTFTDATIPALTAEEVEDFAGAMDDGTNTRLTFVYNDANGNFDIVVDDMNFTPNADPGVNHGSYVAGHGDGGNCAAGEIPLGVDAAGAVEGCYQPVEADITDLAHTAAGGDGTDGTAIHDDTASEISAVTLKGTPISGDFLLIEDSAAGNAKKRITIGSLPAGSEVNDLTASVTWANVPDANVAGVNERDEVCGTTSLSATCELNASVVGATEQDLTDNYAWTGDHDFTGATIDGFFNSDAANSAIAFKFDATITRTTGPIAEFLDNGTFKWRLNDQGNIQMADGGRLFLADGADESSFNSGWGMLAITDTLTGSYNTLGAISMRTRGTVGVNSTSTGLTARGNWFGIRFIPSGNDVVVTEITGAFYEAIDESTGTGHTISNLFGQRINVGTVTAGTTAITSMRGSHAHISFAGTNTAVTEATYFNLTAPTALGSGTTVARLFGINIEDMLGIGTSGNAAIRILPQSGDSGNEGNIDFTAGGYLSGHIQFNDCHLWNDATQALRIKCGSAPTTATDGILIGDHDDLTNFLAAEHLDWAASVGTIHIGNYIEGGDGTDGTAIHDNVASEISAITVKGTPHANDFILIEDSEDSNNKKHILISTLPAGGGGEINTHSSDGGGLALTAATPKVSVDLRLVSLNANHFDSAADLIALDPEGVEDLAGAMGDGTETRITFTYNDTNGNWDIVVDDMNDDVPDAGDFAAAVDLDLNGEVIDDSHNHVITNVDPFTIAQLNTQVSDATLCQLDGTNCDATQAELDAQDECSEITNCTPSAIIGTGVTYEQLDTNSDIGFGAAQVPQGSLVCQSDGTACDATQAELDLKAPLVSPVFTTDPTGPTQAVTDSDLSLATTDFVDRKPTQVCKTIEDLVAADDDILIWIPRVALTVTAVSCQSDAAATVVLEDFGGTAIETIVCETDGAVAWDSSMSGTATLIAGEVIRMDTTSESTPTWTMICFEYRND